MDEFESHLFLPSISEELITYIHRVFISLFITGLILLLLNRKADLPLTLVKVRFGPFYITLIHEV